MWEKKKFLGTGVKFPPQIDPVTGRFQMVSYEEDIKEAIYVILMTSKGERVMQPDFGCNLGEYVFELSNPTYMSLLKKEMIEALVKWEPRIDEIEIDINTTEIYNGKLQLNISYIVRATNNEDNLVFPYYLEAREEDS